ncbi:MAG TPA: ATP-binding cassette domain-containing protein [Devosiaceae bacterium]|nr:ATP-binding cassette domain-containing protein [Devosiaceae bacterium]
MPEYAAEAVGLRKTFTVPDGLFAKRTVAAVDDVNFRLERGESVGLVGESGSGKSTVGRLLLGLIKPSDGDVRVLGRDIAGMRSRELRELRRDIQIVFQNPHTALHPRMNVARALAEPLYIQGGAGRDQIRRRISEMIDVISLPESFLGRYPHELSGGQKQRICIARALMLRPKILVLDEPTSALDVSVQAQILEFLQQLRAEFGLTYLFISHNLAVVQAMCSRILVMYRGKLVEEGASQQVLTSPAHAYTRRLLSATLEPTPDARLPILQPE